MTNKLKLVVRIAAIALCVCLTHSALYGQTSNTESQQEVVKLRSKIDLKNPRWAVFSPVSKLLAVQRKDGSVQVIDLTDGRERTVLPLSDKAYYEMQWTKDGLRLLVVDSKSAAIWDARRGTKLSAAVEIKRGRYFFGFEGVKLSPNEKLFLNVKERESLKGWLLEKDNARAQVWDVESGRLRFEIKINGLEGGAQFSPDSKLILTTSASDEAKLWDVETGKLFAVLKPPEHTTTCGGAWAQFSPDGRFVMVHRYRCGTWVWDSATAILKHTVSLDKDDTASTLLGFTHDGKMFAMARQTLKGWSRRISVEVRDCETGELRSSLADNKWDKWPQYVFWSNDGRMFVATSGHKYKGRVWDVSTGKLKATIPMVLTYSRIPFDFGLKDRDELSLHPTLPVISATSNKFVRLWNAETGELMQTLENTGEMGEWSADGKMFLTSTKDWMWVSVWDVVGPRPTRPRSVTATVSSTGK